MATLRLMTSDVEAGSSQVAGGLTPSSICAEIADWAHLHWRADLSLVEWRTLLAQAGWSAPSWPRRWHGRGWPAWADDVVSDELVRLGTPGNPVGAGMNLAAPTILEHGPDDVRERFLLPTLQGEVTWCQLFSEPGAGSDLAGLSTSAVLDGDEWVVSGQKVWNTSAHHADLGILVARTDWSAPKHKGLTYFVLPMRQPGVTVRPLRQMNHHSSFNEVFLDEARIPRDWVVGRVGDGWSVALTTLAFERRFSSRMRPKFVEAPGRALDEARVEVEHHFETYKWYPQRAGRVDLLVPQARAAGRACDSVVRQGIARALSMQSIAQWTAARAQAARALGRAPGAEGSVGKLAASNLARECARVHALIAGAHGSLMGADAPLDGIVAEVLMSVPGQSIAGGTDEIQKNILGEKMLGLPREPAVDAGLPFNQTRRNV